MAAEFTEDRVTFFSEGVPMVGNLVVPKSASADKPVAGVLCTHGYGGLRETTQPEIARSYGRAGIAALYFDYRGFGESGGNRGVLHPERQIEDARNALSFMTTDARIDEARLGIHGSSFGGAVAISTAARDERIRAVVASIAVGNGKRWLRSLRRNWEWLEFLKELAEDRKQRVLSGTSKRVSPYHIMLPDPESSARHKRLNAELPHRVFEMPLDCGEAILDFRPEDEAAHARPMPGLIITVTNDTIVSDDESHSIYDKWPGPKELIVMHGVRHHDLFSSALDDVMRRTVPFFESNLQSV
jgi:hypothetical protein